MKSLISALSPLKVNKRPKDDDSDSDKADADDEDSKEQTPAVVAPKKQMKELKSKPVIHPTGLGYFTAHGRKLWIAAHPEEYKQNKESVDSLQYDPDESHPLYFWQLHSLLGTRRKAQ